MECDLITEINREMHPFREQFAHADVVRHALALARQKRLAQANARIERALVGGLGEVELVMDAEIYHDLCALYGKATVDSDDFLRALKRDNPDYFVSRNHLRTNRIIVPCDWKAACADVCTDSADAGEPAAHHAA